MEENTTNEVSDYVVEIVDEEPGSNNTESETNVSETGNNNEHSSFDNSSVEISNSSKITNDRRNCI